MTSSSKLYPQVDANPDFPKIEENVLSFWKKNHIFEASIAARPATQGGHSNEFIFYDGPPFANGLPHYGHLLTGSVKDVFARYQTMRGHRVERRFGWDCHGLPAEMGAEKDLGITGRLAIIEYGIDKFNEYCRTSVMKYTKEWEYYVTRQARWVDFAHDYKTMDKNYMESVIWAFKQLYDKGLIYEAYRVMPYSWAAETPLSNFETKLDNSYRERVDKAVTVAFELNKDAIEKQIPDLKNKFQTYKILAWTTTPWTLPSNLALAVSKSISYACLPVGNETCYIVAMSEVPNLIKQLGLAEKLEYGTLCTGLDLVGLTYKPLFPYFKDHPDSFRILDGSGFVTEGDGTGIVHMAPGFGEDDQRVCEANGITIVCPVDGRGRFTDDIYDIYEDGSPVDCAPDAGISTEPSPRLRGDTGGWRLGEAAHSTRGPTAMERAKTLRKNPTDAEKRLWEIVSGKKLDGFKFRRQQAIGNFIVDFVCMEKQLVIELDGSQHIAQEKYDDARTAFLNNLGFKVIRFWNNEVLQNPEGVADKILLELSAPSLASPRNPPPAGGGIAGGWPLGEALHSTRGPTAMSARMQGDSFLTPSPALPLAGGGFSSSCEIFSLKGMNVLEENLENFKFGEANERITQWLKKHGSLIKQEQITHNYPHCWRTDKPLIYRAMPSWYVEVTKFRDRAVELNKQINWIPEHIRDGQMGHMLATAPDWSISRNRFWGTPIPIWKSKSGKLKVFGSIAELEKASGKSIPDLHRPYIDDIMIFENGEEYTRVEDVFDCWFESGSMPFAQVHYPFENKDWFETHFPADFITEYVGQTRGWFNTLIMLSTALFDKPPFENCICHGVVLDSETGLKYSKRLKNYKDPTEVMDRFGADALRWLMIASPVMRGLDLSVDPDGKFIRDVVRLAIKPIWNAYNFFCLYANADGIKAEFSIRSADPMDRYILAKCRSAVQEIEKALDAYDTPSATEAVSRFFEALNNWYIRRTKERFWKKTRDADKQAAYDTLYTVIITICRAAAPLLPLTLEAIYRSLTGETSVHLADFPDVSTWEENKSTLEQMEAARDICNAALAIRNNRNLRVRLPLATLTIVSDRALSPTLDEIIRDEVNVKAIAYEKNVAGYATFKLQLNNQILGKRLPEKMKQIIPAAKKGDWKKAGSKVVVQGETLEPNEFSILLEPKPEIKDRAGPLSTNDALVILDTTITHELELEGFARDLVRLIQQARKDSNLQVTDYIHLRLRMSDKITEALNAYRDYVAEQVLAASLAIGDMQGCNYITNETIENEEISIGFSLSAAAA